MVSLRVIQINAGKYRIISSNKTGIAEFAMLNQDNKVRISKIRLLDPKLVIGEVCRAIYKFIYNNTDGLSEIKEITMDAPAPMILFNYNMGFRIEKNQDVYQPYLAFQKRLDLDYNGFISIWKMVVGNLENPNYSLSNDLIIRLKTHPFFPTAKLLTLRNNPSLKPELKFAEFLKKMPFFQSFNKILNDNKSDDINYIINRLNIEKIMYLTPLGFDNIKSLFNTKKTIQKPISTKIKEPVVNQPELTKVESKKNR